MDNYTKQELTLDERIINHIGHLLVDHAFDCSECKKKLKVFHNDDQQCKKFHQIIGEKK